MSISLQCVDYYSEVFTEFLMPRICYSYFDIMNDHSTRYRYWPEALKMDYFMERCWKVNYEDEAVRKFIYNLT